MDDATTKRLKTALTDAKQAVRAIQFALDAAAENNLEDTNHSRERAEAHLGFALTALRAAAQK